MNPTTEYPTRLFSSKMPSLVTIMIIAVVATVIGATYVANRESDQVQTIPITLPL
jgi:hypothetical protein